jgi:SAM-dependent methyltransferase
MADLATRLNSAIEDQRAGRFAEAIQQYHLILAEEPNQVWALYFLGGLILQGGNAAGAVPLLARAAQLADNIPELHNRLGEAYLALGQFGLAVPSFNRAVRLRPYFAEARINIERAHALAQGGVHWVRQVMYAEGRKLLAGTGPETRDVLEISGDNWRDTLPFKSYRSLHYPEYDVCQAPAPGKFDLVILDQVLEHVRHPQRALTNVRASLRPGGYCFVSTPFLIRVHAAPTDYWRWTVQGLACLLEDSGFDSARIQSGGWGNRECVAANLIRWEVYDPAQHSLENEPEYPVTVWALAQT